MNRGGGRFGGGQRANFQQGGGERRQVKFVAGKIFIGGLTPDTTSEALEAYCGQWGTLSDVHIMLGKNYGFVTFENPSDAQKFFDTKEHLINGKQVDAKAAVPRDQGSNKLTKKMFVGGTTDMTDADFREYFAQFGKVDVASILRKPDGSSRGYGFVTYEDEISVEKCLVQQHTVHSQALDCKRALSREQNQQQQQQQHGGGGQMMGYGGGGGGRGGGGGFPQQMQHQQQQQQQQFPGMMGGHAGGSMGMGGMPVMGMMGAPGMGMMFPMGMGGGGGVHPHHHQQQMMNTAAIMGGGGGGGDHAKQPEWTCQECGNTNFAFRQYCNKCKAVRAGGGGGRGGGGGGDMSMNAAGMGMNMMGAGVGGVGMGGMQMPMGMGMNIMGGGVGGVAGMNPAAMTGLGGVGMMPGGMNMNMMGGGGGVGGGPGMNNNAGGMQMGGGGGYGRSGGGGGGGNVNGQSRFRPY